MVHRRQAAAVAPQPQQSFASPAAASAARFRARAVPVRQAPAPARQAPAPVRAPVRQAAVPARAAQASSSSGDVDTAAMAAKGTLVFEKGAAHCSHCGGEVVVDADLMRRGRVAGLRR
jgi:hypothetical protein